MERRHFIKGLVGLAVIPTAGPLLSRLLAKSVPASLPGAAAGPGSQSIPPLVKSKAEWKRLLTAEQYQVLFQGATERPGSSALDHQFAPGTYVCAACYLPLFHGNTKYDSGTGWPSFWRVIPGHVGTKPDHQLVVPRTEYHCIRCGGHQGHRFTDGPPPTGLRYCNNGVALRFVPADRPLPALRT